MSGFDAAGGALGPGGLSPATLERAQRLIEEAPRQAEAFEATLRAAESPASQAASGAGLGRTDAPATAVPATADPAIATQAAFDPAAPRPSTAPSEAEGARPGLGQELLQSVESSQLRLEEILGQLDSGRTFSPREMLSMQAEMHQIMRQLETTTKAMGEAVSGAKTLFQQQI